MTSKKSKETLRWLGWGLSLVAAVGLEIIFIGGDMDAFKLAKNPDPSISQWASLNDLSLITSLPLYVALALLLVSLMKILEHMRKETKPLIVAISALVFLGGIYHIALMFVLLAM